MKKPQRQQPMGPKAVRGSDAARRMAALLLEAWSGVRTTQAASEAMGVALARFYQLEARALQMMVSAMEPRPRGRHKTPQSELGKLQLERQRLLRDVERFQSLYRTSQRTLGVATAKPDAGGCIAALGPRPVGRPAHVTKVATEEFESMRQRLAELERENVILRAQLELAVLPATTGETPGSKSRGKTATPWSRSPSAGRAVP